MTNSIDETLIDRIHEASFFPERWLPLFEELNSFAGFTQVVMFQADRGGVGRFVANELCLPTLDIYMKEGWGERDELTHRALERREFHFTTNWDMFPGDEFEQTEFYKGLALRCGIGSALGTVVPLPHGELAVFALHRPYREGPADAAVVKALNGLRPEFARAVLTSSRLYLEQARAALDVLTRLRLPACALTGRGRLRLANPLFETLVPDMVGDRAHRLVFSAPEADKLFAATIEKERALTSGRTGLTFPVAAANGLPPHVAHLVPICGDSRDIFASAHWLLIAVPVALSDQVNFSLIENLFDFTAAETAVAGGLLSGKSLNEIAQDRQASVHTVRAQLKAVMSKTGTSRQSDLVRLLSHSQVFGGNDPGKS